MYWQGTGEPGATVMGAKDESFGDRVVDSFIISENESDISFMLS